VSINPAAGTMPNMFDATVKELIYLGDHIRTRVSVCGHDDFVIKIPNSSDHASLKEDDLIHVGWTVEDCRALDSSD
jgi:putative spermidine/putrescine transport system ATP-binding protein